MKEYEKKFWFVPEWYPALAAHTFVTSFVKLHPEAVRLLAEGEEDKDISRQVIRDLRLPMSGIRGNCFTSVDSCAPTDTERFRLKRGAVYSPLSAWKFLCRSEKVRHAAKRGEVSCICLRPFRRMNRTREFRLFIRDGELAAMSQYNLIRHFRRLDGIRDELLKRAEKFFRDVKWLLPEKTLVMDIYFTSDGNTLIIDLNPWGAPTDPLLLQSWDRDWSKPAGLVLMAPPASLSGEVHVSF